MNKTTASTLKLKETDLETHSDLAMLPEQYFVRNKENSNLKGELKQRNTSTVTLKCACVVCYGFKEHYTHAFACIILCLVIVTVAFIIINRTISHKVERGGHIMSTVKDYRRVQHEYIHIPDALKFM